MLYDKRWDRQAINPMDDWRQALIVAADMIERFGHCKGRMTDGTRMCVLGAIGQSGISLPAQYRAEERLAKFICESIVNWNDAPERTAAEVIGTLRKLAVAIQ